MLSNCVYCTEPIKTNKQIGSLLVWNPQCLRTSSAEKLCIHFSCTLIDRNFRNEIINIIRKGPKCCATTIHPLIMPKHYSPRRKLHMSATPPSRATWRHRRSFSKAPPATRSHFSISDYRARAKRGQLLLIKARRRRGEGRWKTAPYGFRYFLQTYELVRSEVLNLDNWY